MPAKSQAQQKFMGIVHAIQKGDAKASDFSKDAQDAAKEMKPSDAKDFASTKHAGLPKKVGKEGVEQKLKEIIRQTYRESLRESINEAYPTDLKVGSVILGQGFTMLKGIEGGKYYKVVAMDSYSATLVPSDKSGNVKGSTKVRHKLDSIEGGIKTAKRGDENGIVVIKESVTEGKKAFKVNPGIGKAKYSISSHDGVKKHKDGSDFWDIEIFKNKVDLEKAIKNYSSKGFVKEGIEINEDIKSDINKFLDKLNKQFPDQEYTTDFKGGKYARITHQSRKFGQPSAWGFVSMDDNPSKGFKKGDLLKAAGYNTPAKNSRGNILDGTAKYDKYSPIYLRGN